MLQGGTHTGCFRHWCLGCTHLNICTSPEEARCTLRAIRRLPTRRGNVQPLQLSQAKDCSTHSMVPRAAAESAEPQAKPAASQHSVVALIDPTPYLSDGSQQALAAAIKSVYTSSSKVTVVLLDATNLADADRKTRLETVVWHFQQADFSNFEVLEKQADTPSVTIGDVADEVGADLLIMSVEPVHAKSVDANLLAEFVPCPMLLLP